MPPAPRRPRPRSLLRALLLGAVAALFTVPAGASASTIALQLEGQASAGRPFNVIAEGVAQNNADFYTSNLTARIKPVDFGLPCGPDLQTDAGSIVMIGYAVANGPYRVPLPITVEEPGQWLLCVWFDSVSADSHTSASLVIDVGAAPSGGGTPGPAPGTTTPPPAGPGASTLALRLERAAVEDRSFNVIAEGVAHNDREWNTSNLTARIKEITPGAACGPDFHTDAGSIVSLAYAVASGAYRVPLPITVDEPGKMLLCVWFDSVSATPHTSASLVIAVRSPSHRLTVSAPARIKRGRAAVVRLRGTAALPRLLLTRVIRGQAGCGQAYASRVASPRLVAVRPVKRAIGFSVRTKRFTRPGTYTVCAYLQEQVGEPRAERIARRVVRVVR